VLPVYQIRCLTLIVDAFLFPAGEMLPSKLDLWAQQNLKAKRSICLGILEKVENGIYLSSSSASCDELETK